MQMHEADSITTSAPLADVHVRLDDYATRINHAMQQNHAPAIRRLSIENAESQPLHDVTILCGFEGGLAPPWGTQLQRIDARKTYDIAPVPWRLPHGTCCTSRFIEDHALKVKTLGV